MAEITDEKTDETRLASTSRKPYSPPALVEYGSVAKLTTKPGSMSDADPAFTHNTPCL